jgi:hypothetical protein
VSRGSAAIKTFVVVGGLGTAFMGRWDAFSIGFSFLFWGGVAAAIAWIAGRRAGVGVDDEGTIFDRDAESLMDYQQVNPATGLPMMGNTISGLDAGGNTYGTTDASDEIGGVGQSR